MAGEGGVKGLADVVFGLGNISGIGGVDAVDGAGVEDLAFLIDHEHVGGGFGFVLLTDLSGGVEEDRGGVGVLVLGVGVGLGTGAVPLLAGSGGDNG